MREREREEEEAMMRERERASMKIHYEDISFVHSSRSFIAETMFAVHSFCWQLFAVVSRTWTGKRGTSRRNEHLKWNLCQLKNSLLLPPLVAHFTFFEPRSIVGLFIPLNNHFFCCLRRFNYSQRSLKIIKKSSSFHSATNTHKTIMFNN